MPLGWFLFVAAAVPLSALSDATPTTYTFAAVGGRPLQLAFWAANTTSTTPAPLVIYIHGGGWRIGAWNRNVKALPLLEHGFAIASVQYRLTSEAGQWGNESVLWPAQAHDVKAAIRWLRGNADMLRVDPNAFISFGGSAGGHLSSILATTEGVGYLEGMLGNYTSVPSKVTLAVDWYGPSSFLHLDEDKAKVGPPQFPKDMQREGLDAPESQLFGSSTTNITLTQIINHSQATTAPWEELVRLATMASPAWYAAGNAGAKLPPPMLISHGDNDSQVPLTQSYRLHEVLVERGVDVMMMAVPKGEHRAVNWPIEVMLEVINGWVQEHLRDSKARVVFS